MLFVADVTLTPEQLAHAFTEMTDDDVARFFDEVSRRLTAWSAHGRIMQAHFIGRHLAECSCGEYGREFVREIYEAMAEAMTRPNSAREVG
jgi:hypothetical protein